MMSQVCYLINHAIPSALANATWLFGIFVAFYVTVKNFLLLQLYDLATYIMHLCCDVCLLFSAY